MYEQFYQAFNLFNVLKNDILKMLTQAKESMILPEEYITKIKEEFREQGVKEPKNLYNQVLDSFKSQINKLEENFCEMTKIVQLKTKDREN